MKIGLMIAMQKELDLFAKETSNFTTQTIGNKTFLCGQIGNHEITATAGGIGKVNAALCAETLITAYHPDFILNIGISGGLDSSLQIGDFILGEDIVYHDVWCGEGNEYGQIQDLPLYYHSDADLIARLPQFKKGLLCCGDQFITDIKELRAIKDKFPQALAVDMESAAIAQTCYLRRMPFLSVRQISDIPGAKQHQEQYDNFWRNAPQHSITTLKQILDTL